MSRAQKLRESAAALEALVAAKEGQGGSRLRQVAEELSETEQPEPAATAAQPSSSPAAPPKRQKKQRTEAAVTAESSGGDKVRRTSRAAQLPPDPKQSSIAFGNGSLGAKPRPSAAAAAAVTAPPPVAQQPRPAPSPQAVTVPPAPPQHFAASTTAPPAGSRRSAAAAAPSGDYMDDLLKELEGGDSEPSARVVDDGATYSGRDRQRPTAAAHAAAAPLWGNRTAEATGLLDTPAPALASHATAPTGAVGSGARGPSRPGGEYDSPVPVVSMLDDDELQAEEDTTGTTTTTTEPTGRGPAPAPVKGAPMRMPAAEGVPAAAAVAAAPSLASVPAAISPSAPAVSAAGEAPGSWFSMQQDELVEAPADSGGAQGDDSTSADGPAVGSAAGPAAESRIADFDEHGLRMYYFDAFEAPASATGVVFLIGKALVGSGQTESCCLAVQNMERNVFLLPRPLAVADPTRPEETVTDREVRMSDVYEEFDAVARAHGIKKWRSRPTEKKYAFDRAAEGVPLVANYLEVLYSAKFPVLPRSLSGRTFSVAFGTHSTMLEQLLLQRQLMGPCWIRVRGAKPVSAASAQSWCRHEYETASPASVEVMKPEEAPPVPPFRVMSLAIKTVLNPGSHRHEVAVVSALTHEAVSVEGAPENPNRLSHWTLACPGRGQAWPFDLTEAIARSTRPGARPSLVPCGSESALLNNFIARLHREDPDVLVGHGLHGHMLEVLLDRMQALGNRQWSKLGRLRRSRVPRSGGGGFTVVDQGACVGRLPVDTEVSAKELVRLNNYSLGFVAETQLGQQRLDIDVNLVPGYFAKSPDVIFLARHTENDAYLALQVAFKLMVLPLTRQLTELAGNLWLRSLRSARAERIEYLLLHEFHNLGFIPPEKLSAKERREMLAELKERAAQQQRAASRGNKKKQQQQQLHKKKKQQQQQKKGDGNDDDDNNNDDDDADGEAAAAAAAAAAQHEAESAELEEALAAAEAHEDGDDGAEDDAEVNGDGADDGGGGRGGGEVGGARGRKKRKPDYSGGLVLEPVVGFYDRYVVMLDFNSLYPSIIREFNICFTTVKHWGLEGRPADLPDAGTAPPGVLPAVMKRLLERRGQVKQLLKKESRESVRTQLDIRQKALKLVANSMYGCLGFPDSRFYCRPLAALVTTQGREILQRTKDLAESLQFQVIYGDTDSIMIHTGQDDLDRARAMGLQLRKEVNKQYKVLEIALDGVFQAMLLLKKKKYAALAVVERPGPGGSTVVATEREVKGLDMVRRDWSELSKDASNFVLDQILSGAQRDAVVAAIYQQLEALAADLREGRVALRKFIITKGLTKDPAAYPNPRSQPHVLVALDMMQRGRAVRAGDHIPFVVCEGDKPMAERCFHPEVVHQAGGALRPDVSWYLSNQILPPVSRLCAPIEETSPSQLAAALGMDPSRFAALEAAHSAREQVEDMAMRKVSRVDDEERWRECARLQVTCPVCSVSFEFAGVFDYGHGQELRSGLTCRTPDCKGISCGPGSDAFLQNSVDRLVRQEIRRAAAGVFACRGCGKTARGLALRGLCRDPDCREQVTEEKYAPSKLYEQLMYLSSLFDVRRAHVVLSNEPEKSPFKSASAPSLPPEHLEAYSRVMEHIRTRYINRIDYCFVSPSVYVPPSTR